MDAMKQNLTYTPHIDKYGTKHYLLPDGKTLHRVDGPAVESAHGNKAWYFNGKRHRVDGPAVECTDGHKEWWINGKRHREDEPALEYANGYKEWWIKEKRHREDGPAIEHPNGDKEWYLNGVEYSFEEWQVARKMLWIL